MDPLIHEWNDPSDFKPPGLLAFQDETLRDGLQSPSVVNPSMDDKRALIGLMDHLGIHSVCIGLPGAGPRAAEDCLALARFVAQERLHCTVACAARTVAADIDPVLQISQAAGLPMELMAFIGSSPVRQYVEGWDIAWIKRHSTEAIRLGVKEGLKVTYVVEDAIRSRPEALTELFSNAIEQGAHRVCLCDTVGHATPSGTRRLIRFTRDLITSLGAKVGIDWHGHADRGLALVNALAAVEAGATRIHGTALGIGERVGNTPMELLLVNLRLAGAISNDLSSLVKYARLAARACQIPVPASHPLVGDDAFRTTTGVHASAVLKARRKGNAWLADRVYSGVPAGEFGCGQRIDIGPMSGASNVVWWLEQRGYPTDDMLVRTILAQAKRSHRVLTDTDVDRAARSHLAGRSNLERSE